MMADTEVENTLREIRERVLAASAAQAPTPAAGDAAAHDAGALTRGADALSGDAVTLARDAGAPAAGAHAGAAGEALARMSANLSTTARAWSRLPPLLSYRSGAAARFELWLKRLVKRAAHWFTWEQVNFNSAAHNALGDARDALEAHGRALEAQERALAALREELRVKALVELREELRAEMRGEFREEVREETRAETREALGRLRSEFEARVAREESRAGELRARLASAESRFEAELAGLRQSLSEEARGRAEGVLEEQRVCFRQLSLEASELAVTQDRARRAVEARLEALEKAVSREP
jgi:hypothetical protein